VEIVPTVPFPPADPFTLHITPVFELPVTVAAYCEDVPSVTVPAPLRERVTAGGGGGEASVTIRFRATVVSATLVAVMVTFKELGWVAGAVYKPFVEIMPTVWFPPATPFTLQVTPLFELPVTVAAYCEDVPSVTVPAPLRLSVTVGGGGGGEASVMVRLSATEGSAMLVAVIVIFEEPASLTGAV
jgi:hypothetical protein